MPYNSFEFNSFYLDDDKFSPIFKNQLELITFHSTPSDFIQFNSIPPDSFEFNLFYQFQLKW